MNLPKRTDLPFFAYGTFKPGQLCFARIRQFVSGRAEAAIPGSLKERDGIPLFVADPKSKNLIKGVVLNFIPEKKIDAYHRIIEIEPDEVYLWKELTTEAGIVVNTFVGKRETRGSSDLEHFDQWDGRSDPFFTTALEEIHIIIDENPTFHHDCRSLFRLQMAYSLLWSAIERYVSLKYSLAENPMKNIIRISEENEFKESLNRNVGEKMYIYNSKNLDREVLDSCFPEKSIKYYYQVRSNSLHRGKAIYRDFDTVRSSLIELLKIFEDLLDKAFSEE